MPTFDESWSGRLRVVGELERQDHWYLTPEDNCAFFGEYTARGGYGASSTNQIVHNLKKSPDLAGTQQYAWKARSIRDVGAVLRASLNTQALPHTAIIPIPPSKPPGAEGFDDRMAQVARAIGPQADVREALYTAHPREAMHLNNNHRDPQALRASLAVDLARLGQPTPNVVLLDDVLTTGCSFMVCQQIVREHWPEARVYGIFVARRIIPQGDPAEAFGIVV
jgi:hypothetical protein